jgi:acyl-CoA synthetase (AMP-forming)/AMP-acid ligase II
MAQPAPDVLALHAAAQPDKPAVIDDRPGRARTVWTFAELNAQANRLGNALHGLGIRPGETTPDGRFTLSTAECLGSCGTAPMMQVGDEYYENLDVATVDKILNELK